MILFYYILFPEMLRLFNIVWICLDDFPNFFVNSLCLGLPCCPWGMFIAFYSLGHATKNCAGQLVSPVRNIKFGSYFVDSTGCRSLGMPPTAYTRSEPMSDALHCTMWNPYYCVKSPVPGL